jgi:hypothetical protein
MKETPIFNASNKKGNTNQFYRNYWCTRYDTCLDIAARKDADLDCTQCFLKDNVIDVFSIFINKGGG